MMTGTIRGARTSPVNSWRRRPPSRSRPRAASTPRTSASAVVRSATRTLVPSEVSHSGSRKNSRYQRVDTPGGGIRRCESGFTEAGTTARIGSTRNPSVSAARAWTATRIGAAGVTGRRQDRAQGDESHGRREETEDHPEEREGRRRRQGPDEALVHQGLDEGRYHQVAEAAQERGGDEEAEGQEEDEHRARRHAGSVSGR